MNWRRPFWTAFAAIGGSALLLALILLWWTRSNFADADTAFRSAASEQRQLESGNPYPSEANVRKMRGHLAEYRASLDKLKAELGTHVLATPQIAPNEFQTRLLDAITATANNAREHRVKLPENFKLGFDEFVSSLPKTEEAPKLGQELAQIQLLLNLVIEARVDAVTMFRRVKNEPAQAQTIAPQLAPQRLPPTGETAEQKKQLATRAVEFTISAPASALRKVINQISSSGDQFYIIRTVHVKSQKDKGPTRETASAAAATPTPPANPAGATANATPASTPPGAIQFVVGNEHVDLSARVELVDFNF
ncbi:MAG: Amuc_1100 family pilus-like protein [Verrucomicrobia bacterium]|nr:Amuc_1100 family pilus-like protein [Verrucomicrobiota bacterium]